MPQCNVLRVNEVEEQAAYKTAVSEIVRNIINDLGTTLVDIAEAVNVSLGTVSNAFNKKGVLNPLFLNRLGQVYGATYLNPYIRLCGGVVHPLVGDTHDILPLMLATGGQIAEARSPGS